MLDRFVILTVVALVFLSAFQGGDALVHCRRRRVRPYRSVDNALIRERRDLKDRTCEAGVLSLLNGKVICSDGNKALSFCSFTCNEGYKMVNKHAAVLFCDGKEWSGTKPTCESVE